MEKRSMARLAGTFAGGHQLSIVQSSEMIYDETYLKKITAHHNDDNKRNA
jgi:hypothetical protein